MRQGLGLFNAMVTMLVVTVILVWMVTTLTNGDPLWFVSSFNARAEAITIYWEGARVTLHPGDAGYAEVMDAFAEGIAHPVGYEGKVAFSEENIARYRADFKLLEMQFAQPVQVHTRHPYTKAKTFLMPLDKTHAQWRRVFAFKGLVPYTSGPLNMSEENFDALYNAIERVMAPNTSL